jgi:putative CocE/NonD family hydrolase
VTVERGVRLRLRDGTILVSDHYYPPGDTPAPTLLVRQPYGRAVATTVVYAQPAWFAANGYNVVIQDVRGRGESTGEFQPFVHEGKDGAATIAWLAARPECTGRVGMYGFSYQGMTQLLAAAENPPALRCITPAQTAGDLFHGWFYHHGAFRLTSGMGWAAQMLKADARRQRLRAASDALESAWQNLAALYAATPYGTAPALSARGLPRYGRDWMHHREAGPFWSRQDITGREHRIHVPALHVWGWFDTYLHGSELLYRALSEKAAPEARDLQYLVAGPWTHIPWSRFAGEADHGPEAAIDTDALLLRWFNHWLKDSGEFAAEPRVRSFALGENRWHSLDRWPTGPDADLLVLHLASNGRANSSKGDGLLRADPSGGGASRDTFAYEPEVPVGGPGPGGASGVFHQARSDSLNHVLVYTGSALTEKVHVFGIPRVRLHATSRLAQADLFVKLVRVLPDGRSLNVCHGIARGSWLFRETGHEPDAVTLWEFPLEPTDCVFAPGERIRITVSGSAFPLYDRNPGSDVPPHLATSWDWVQNQQQVVHDEVHPSSILLPLAPGS